MTTDSFDRRLAAWLDEHGERRVPDHLSEVLVRTASTRQRSAWSSLERWLPVTATFRAQLRAAPVAPVRVVLAVILLALIIAATLFTSGRPRHLPGLGLATNGRIAFVDGSSIRTAAADGSSPSTLATAARVLSLHWSVDGTRLAYRTDAPDGKVLVVDADGSHSVNVAPGLPLAGDDEVAWSPDSTSLVFASDANGSAVLVVAKADGSGYSQIKVGEAVDTIQHPAWSPDGRLISYFGQRVAAEPAVLHVVAPDGSGDSVLTGVPADAELGGGTWAPTPAQQRIVYVSGDNVAVPSSVHVVDVRTGTDVYIADGFWPSWSPDGGRIAWYGDGTVWTASAAGLAGGAWHLTQLQERGAGGTCGNAPELAGKALCGPPVWSPDGHRVIAVDVLGQAMVALSADAAAVGAPAAPLTISLQTNADLGGGQGAPVGWQPIEP